MLLTVWFSRLMSDTDVDVGSHSMAISVRGLMLTPRMFWFTDTVTSGAAALTVPFPLVASDPVCVYVKLVLEGTVVTVNVPSKEASSTPAIVTCSFTVSP